MNIEIEIEIEKKVLNVDHMFHVNIIAMKIDVC